MKTRTMLAPKSTNKKRVKKGKKRGGGISQKKPKTELRPDLQRGGRNAEWGTLSRERYESNKKKREFASKD